MRFPLPSCYAVSVDTLRPTGRIVDGRNIYEGYDTALICGNGHVITVYAESHPEVREEYCSKCGAKTVTCCPHCESKIRGHLHPHMPSVYEKLAPKFCYQCGKAYPWTEKGIKAARELLAEADNLTDAERDSLSGSLDDLVRDTPNTPVAVRRFKKYLPKAGREIADAVRSVMVDIASEAVKKSIWPGP